MIKRFLILFNKEMNTILRDRKSFLSFIILSVLLTPILIVGVGLIEDLQRSQLENEEVKIAISTGADSSLASFVKNSDVVKVVDSSDLERDLEEGEIAGYLEINIEDEVTKTKYIYNQSSNLSTASLVKVQALTQTFSSLERAKVLAEYSLSESQLNPVEFSGITLQEVQNKPVQSSFILFLLPYIILIGLIQGAAQFAIELTAGEKEKNTLATTLSLNASRLTIGLAKISAILCFSILSLTLNILSLVLAFGLLSSGIFQGSDATNGVSNFGQLNISLEMIAQIFIVLLPLSILISALLILLGIFARNAKEGGLYTLPLIFASIFIGISGQAFDTNAPAWLFGVPLLGQVVLIRQILLSEFIAINFFISLIVSSILFVIILFTSIRMFSREEVIFRQ